MSLELNPYEMGIPIKFVMTTDGKLGIGTTQPSEALYCVGNIYATEDGSFRNLRVRGDTSLLETNTSNTGFFSINNTSAVTALSITHSGGGSAMPLVATRTSSGYNAFHIRSNGNVGIGTTLPTTALQVIGTIACTSMTGDASAVTGLAASAKIDTTNATNITAGTLAAPRVASVLLSTGFTGNVGIGTMVAGSSLTVRGAADFGPPRIPQSPFTANTMTLTTATTFQRLTGNYVISSSLPASTPYFAFDQNGGSTKWITDNDYTPTYVRGTEYVYTQDARNFSAIPTSIIYEGHWLQIQCPSPIFLYSYGLRSDSILTQTPSTWTLLGSTNGADDTWNNLATVTDYVWVNTAIPQTFVINSSVAYRYYRIAIQKVAGTPASRGPVAVSEFILNGDTLPYDGVRIQGGLNIGLDRAAMDGNTNNIPWFHVNPSTGNVGVGTTNPLSRLHIQTGQVRVSALAPISGTSTVNINAQGVLGVTTSDERLKHQIEPLSYGLKEILALNPVHFHWRDEEVYGSQKESGLLAQEVARVMPEMVNEQRDGVLSLDYVKLVPILIKAIQELANR